jgi:hypothetical protein
MSGSTAEVRPERGIGWEFPESVTIGHAFVVEALARMGATWEVLNLLGEDCLGDFIDLTDGGGVLRCAAFGDISIAAEDAGTDAVSVAVKVRETEIAADMCRALGLSEQADLFEEISRRVFEAGSVDVESATSGHEPAVYLGLVPSDVDDRLNRILDTARSLDVEVKEIKGRVKELTQHVEK